MIDATFSICCACFVHVMARSNSHVVRQVGCGRIRILTFRLSFNVLLFVIHFRNGTCRRLVLAFRHSRAYHGVFNYLGVRDRFFLLLAFGFLVNCRLQARVNCYHAGGAYVNFNGMFFQHCRRFTNELCVGTAGTKVLYFRLRKSHCRYRLHSAAYAFFHRNGPRFSKEVITSGASEIGLLVDQPNYGRCFLALRLAIYEGGFVRRASSVLQFLRASLPCGVANGLAHAQLSGVVTMEAGCLRVLLDNEVDVRVRIRDQDCGRQDFHQGVNHCRRVVDCPIYRFTGNENDNKDCRRHVYPRSRIGITIPHSIALNGRFASSQFTNRDQ